MQKKPAWVLALESWEQAGLRARRWLQLLLVLDVVLLCTSLASASALDTHLPSWAFLGQLGLLGALLLSDVALLDRQHLYQAGLVRIAALFLLGVSSICGLLGGHYLSGIITLLGSAVLAFAGNAAAQNKHQQLLAERLLVIFFDGIRTKPDALAGFVEMLRDYGEERRDARTQKVCQSLTGHAPPVAHTALEAARTLRLVFRARGLIS